MYSTQKNITDKKPAINPDAVCSKYFQYPDETSKRQTEGGLRLNGQYKQSLKDKPLITVITVIYNNEETLERCIKSVLEQTYDNIEYIVIDGGSSDGTLDIIKKYQDSIDYYISEPDGGIYYAMNKGIALASGDYIYFANSDDWVYPKSIQTIAEKSINSNPEYIFGNIKQEHRVYRGNEYKERVFFTSPFPHPSMFTSRECFNKYGNFDASMKIAADYDFVVRLYVNNASFIYIDEIISFFSEGGVSDHNHNNNDNHIHQSERNTIKNRHLSQNLNLSVEDQIELFPYYEMEHEDKLPDAKRMIELLRKTQQSDNREMVIDYLIAYIHFLNIVIQRPPSVKTCNDKWYLFGQLSKKDKLIKIMKYPFKNIFQIRKGK